MITCEVTRTVDPDSWNSWVSDSPGRSIFQTTYWANYLAAYRGALPYYMRVLDGGCLVGQLLAVEMPGLGESALTPVRRWVARAVAPLFMGLSWREGPVIRGAHDPAEIARVFLRGVRDLVTDRRLAGVESGFLPLVGTTEDVLDAFAELGYVGEPRRTVRIEVDRPLEVLWAGLKSDVARTPIRKGERLGLRLVEASTPTDLDRYCDLVEVSRREAGLPPHPRAKFVEMFKQMGGHVSVFLAEANGQPLSGAGLWHFGGRAYLFTPAQARAARESRIYAGDFLFWQMIRWCHLRGLTTLDLSGIAPDPVDEKEKGIRRFKEKWGGSVVSYTAFALPLRKWRWVMLDRLRRLRKAARTGLHTKRGGGRVREVDGAVAVPSRGSGARALGGQR